MSQTIPDLFNADQPETEEQITQLHQNLNPQYAFVCDELAIQELFTEQIPIVGRVPILFYVPDVTPSARSIRRLIEAHGGIVIYIPECCCYQVFPESEDFTEKVGLEDYSKGLIYSSNWLTESIASERLLSCKPYLKSTVTVTHK
jgi:hypothetical protein